MNHRETWYVFDGAYVESTSYVEWGVGVLHIDSDGDETYFRWDEIRTIETYCSEDGEDTAWKIVGRKWRNLFDETGDVVLDRGLCESYGRGIPRVGDMPEVMLENDLIWNRFPHPVFDDSGEAFRRIQPVSF